MRDVELGRDYMFYELAELFLFAKSVNNLLAEILDDSFLIHLY